VSVGGTGRFRTRKLIKSQEAAYQENVGLIHSGKPDSFRTSGKQAMC
jgi:hypothetical protein